MSFRQVLPAGIESAGFTAADGQMGCIMKLHREWQLGGDTDWLRKIWPRAKKVLEFAWIRNGWDGDKDGVMEGVQHSTYDVEFYGPNPQCGVWYLGALRAAEEMARAVGDEGSAAEYRRLFEGGRNWIDANLFNGEYYIQQVRPTTVEQIAEGLLLGRGTPRHRPENPFHQVADGCLVDQLVGQYFAHVTGLGYLLDEGNIRTALKSLFRYNFRKSMKEHESVHRVFALNDDAALLICTYPKGERPELPFWFFMEVMTGFEYQAAVHMIYEGLLKEGLAVVEAIRARYDGARRSPWNEAECGHHYARAMASWGLLPALAGFQYSAVSGTMAFRPRVNAHDFRTFWSTAKAWGRFSQKGSGGSFRASVEVIEGTLACETLRLAAGARARLDGEEVSVSASEFEGGVALKLGERIEIAAGQKLEILG
jgi:uncharacterized protein (DUF608 family)